MDIRLFFKLTHLFFLFVVFLFSASFTFADEDDGEGVDGSDYLDSDDTSIRRALPVEEVEEQDLGELDTSNVEETKDKLQNLREALKRKDEAEKARREAQERGEDTTEEEEQVEQAQEDVADAEEEVKTAYAEGSTAELQRAVVELSDEDLPVEERLEITRELEGRKDCSDNWWSFACRLIKDDEAKDLQTRRTREQIAQNTRDAQNLEQYNEQLMNTVNTEIGGYLSDEEFDESKCEAPTSECRDQIESISCDDDASCERRKESALETFDVARNEYRVEENAFLEVAGYLNVDEGSYQIANFVQDITGFEVSLIERGSAIDDILSFGTPEQVCLAKVDSFMSAEGVNIEGETYDAPEQNTDFKTRQKACDNFEFEICADLRAEKSGLFFENRFNIIVHFFVYNPNDYEQEFIVNAELTNDNSEKVNFNVFENSSQVEGNSITLKSGEKSSMSIILSKLSPFDSNDYSEVYGNVILSVHKKSGEGGNFGPGNLEYALDYPLMSIQGSSSTPDQLKKDVENSGAEATDGVSDPQTFSNSLVDRVNIG